MPAEQGNDAERFAAAVDMGRTPGSADAELARDLEIVAMLRSRTAEYSPHPDAKARAKERLMAVLAAEQADAAQRDPGPQLTAGRRPADPSAPRLSPPLTPGERTAPLSHPVPSDALSVTAQLPAVDAEPDTGLRGSGARSGRRGRHTMPSRPARSAGASRPSRPGPSRRAVLVGAAAMVMLVALTGGGIFASRDALPGDSLYAVKRAAESAGLALTFDEAAKARRQLELAGIRLDEIEKMARAPQSNVEVALYRSAIKDFDTATGEGSRMVLAGSDTGEVASLGNLGSWASTQAARLASISVALPAAVVDGAKDSIQLLDRVKGRAAALQVRSACTEITSGGVDDLGPLPAQGACAPRPVDPSKKARGSGGTSPSDQSGAGTSSPGSEAQTTPGGQPNSGGLLPDLNNPGLGLPPVGTSTAGAPTGPSAPGGPANVSIPLPLLPPITLPPLIPGTPGITIG